MASASFVEIISHFAGYLADLPRHRPRPAPSTIETRAPGRPDDYTTLPTESHYPVAPDDVDTKGGSVPALIADDPMDVFRGRPLKLLRDYRSTPMMISPRLRSIRKSRCRHMAAVAAAAPIITSG